MSKHLYKVSISFDVVVAADSPEEARLQVNDAYTTLYNREFESSRHSADWIEKEADLPEGWSGAHIPLYGEPGRTIDFYLNETEEPGAGDDDPRMPVVQTETWL